GGDDIDSGEHRRRGQEGEPLAPCSPSALDQVAYDRRADNDPRGDQQADKRQQQPGARSENEDERNAERQEADEKHDLERRGVVLGPRAVDYQRRQEADDGKERPLMVSVRKQTDRLALVMDGVSVERGMVAAERLQEAEEHAARSGNDEKPQHMEAPA